MMSSSGLAELIDASRYRRLALETVTSSYRTGSGTGAGGRSQRAERGLHRLHQRELRLAVDELLAQLIGLHVRLIGDELDLLLQRADLILVRRGQRAEQRLRRDLPRQRAGELRRQPGYAGEIGTQLPDDAGRSREELRDHARVRGQRRAELGDVEVVQATAGPLERLRRDTALGGRVRRAARRGRVDGKAGIERQTDRGERVVRRG